MKSFHAVTNRYDAMAKGLLHPRITSYATSCKFSNNAVCLSVTRGLAGGLLLCRTQVLCVVLPLAVVGLSLVSGGVPHTIRR